MELWSVHYCANINDDRYLSKTDCHSNDIETPRTRKKKTLNFWHFFYFTQFTSFNALFPLIRSLLVRAYIIEYLHKISYYFPPRNDRSHFFPLFSQFFFASFLFHIESFYRRLWLRNSVDAFYITFICLEALVSRFLSRFFSLLSIVVFSVSFSFAHFVSDGQPLRFYACVRQFYRLVVKTHTRVTYICVCSLVVVSFSFSSTSIYADKTKPWSM